jgi:hypothetical protein
MSRDPECPLELHVRRRIVRFLHRDFAAHARGEIAAELRLGAEAVRYHCRVLAAWGTVKEYEGPAGILIESLVSEDPEVLFLLHATEAEDRYVENAGSADARSC